MKCLKKLDSILKSREITLLTKVSTDKAMVFPVVMYGCESDHKESWVPKNWCFWALMLEKTLESHLNSKEIKPVIPKENQSWIFIRRNDAESEAPILWPPDAKSWLIKKDPDTGKDWRQEEKVATGWDDWMKSLTQWTWIWANPGRWWRTGKPGMLQSMGSQRAGHYWATEQQRWKVPNQK